MDLPPTLSNSNGEKGLLASLGSWPPLLVRIFKKNPFLSMLVILNFQTFLLLPLKGYFLSPFFGDNWWHFNLKWQNKKFVGFDFIFGIDKSEYSKDWFDEFDRWTSNRTRKTRVERKSWSEKSNRSFRNQNWECRTPRRCWDDGI